MRLPKPDFPSDRVKHLEKRIKELNDKASQLLLFLSFALVVAAILETTGHQLGPLQTELLTRGMRCWTYAIFPILIAVLPVKELRERSEGWYKFIRCSKFLLLLAAILIIMNGTRFFVHAIYHLGSTKW
jgi:hypothetical protein